MSARIVCRKAGPCMYTTINFSFYADLSCNVGRTAPHQHGTPTDVAVGKRAITECAICCEPFKWYSHIGETECGHVFCYRCLDKWLTNTEASGTQMRCPMCRSACSSIGSNKVIPVLDPEIEGCAKCVREIKSSNPAKRTFVLSESQDFRLTNATWFILDWSEKNSDRQGCRIVSDGQVEYLDYDNLLSKHGNSIPAIHINIPISSFTTGGICEQRQAPTPCYLRTPITTLGPQNTTGDITAPSTDMGKHYIPRTACFDI